MPPPLNRIPETFSKINDKKASVLDVIQKVFRFYKSTIAGVMSLAFVGSTFSLLGTKLGLISAVVVILIAFFGMGIALFKPEKIDGLSPAIEAKTDTIGGTPKSNISKLLAQSGGGAEFIKEIKKITKKFKST